MYCYTPDGRGPCYAVEGQKIMLQWFRSYLVIVAKDTKTVTRATTAVSATSTKLVPSVNSTGSLVPYMHYKDIYSSRTSKLPPLSPASSDMKSRGMNIIDLGTIVCKFWFLLAVMAGIDFWKRTC